MRAAGRFAVRFAVHFTALPLILLLLLAASCEDKLSPAARLWTQGDTQAPVFVKIQAQDAQTFVMYFDEDIASSASISGADAAGAAMDIQTATASGRALSFTLGTPTTPGSQYTVTATVRDMRGNSALIVQTIYGFNPDLPRMLINEFITEGTKTNGDKVEIIALEDGNVAGATLREGGVYTYEQQVIFPSIAVKKGDFIVVHWRAEASAERTSERAAKNESAHPQSYDTAWDIFSDADAGIGNANGALTLLAHPGGTVLDAVVYSNKIDDAADATRGFGSEKIFTWIQEIETASLWSHAGNAIMPSDAVNPEQSTVTRSINRSSASEDTDSAADWHIVPTGKSSFGAANTDSVHTP